MKIKEVLVLIDAIVDGRLLSKSEFNDLNNALATNTVLRFMAEANCLPNKFKDIWQKHRDHHYEAGNVHDAVFDTMRSQVRDWLKNQAYNQMTLKNIDNLHKKIRSMMQRRNIRDVYLTRYVNKIFDILRQPLQKESGGLSDRVKQDIFMGIEYYSHHHFEDILPIIKEGMTTYGDGSDDSHYTCWMGLGERLLDGVIGASRDKHGLTDQKSAYKEYAMHILSSYGSGTELRILLSGLFHIMGFEDLQWSTKVRDVYSLRYNKDLISESTDRRKSEQIWFDHSYTDDDIKELANEILSIPTVDKTPESGYFGAFVSKQIHKKLPLKIYKRSFLNLYVGYGVRSDENHVYIEVEQGKSQIMTQDLAQKVARDYLLRQCHREMERYSRSLEKPQLQLPKGFDFKVDQETYFVSESDWKDDFEQQYEKIMYEPGHSELVMRQLAKKTQIDIEELRLMLVRHCGVEGLLRALSNILDDDILTKPFSKKDLMINIMRDKAKRISFATEAYMEWQATTNKEYDHLCQWESDMTWDEIQMHASSIAPDNLDSSVYKFMLKHRDDTKIPYSVPDDYDIEDTFLWSAHMGLDQTISLMIARGQDINAMDINGNTALMIAAKEGHFEVVKRLIDKGANTNITDRSHTSLLCHVAMKGYLDIFRLLFDKIEDKSIITEALIESSLDGNTEIVKFLISSGVDVNCKDFYGETALNAAAERNHVDTVKYLITAGANLDVEIGTGRQSLMVWAVDNNHPDVVSLLVDRGCDVNELNEDKEPLILLATRSHNIGMVRALIASEDILIDQSDPSGSTALYTSLQQKENREMIREILSANPDVNSHKYKRSSMLAMAARNSYIDVVLEMLEMGADVKTKIAGESVIEWAIRHNHSEIVEYLLTEKRQQLGIPQNQKKLSQFCMTMLCSKSISHEMMCSFVGPLSYEDHADIINAILSEPKLIKKHFLSVCSFITEVVSQEAIKSTQWSDNDNSRIVEILNTLERHNQISLMSQVISNCNVDIGQLKKKGLIISFVSLLKMIFINMIQLFNYIFTKSEKPVRVDQKQSKVIVSDKIVDEKLLDRKVHLSKKRKPSPDMKIHSQAKKRKTHPNKLKP